ncbi:hypothetical protein WAI453_007167 [Rhynchosporium graminicola]
MSRFLSHIRISPVQTPPGDAYLHNQVRCQKEIGYGYLKGLAHFRNWLDIVLPWTVNIEIFQKAIHINPWWGISSTPISCPR